MWIVLFLFGGRIDAIAHLPHNAQMVFWAGSFVLLPVFIYQIWSIGSGQTETAMKENPDEASWDTPMDETLRVEASDSANQVRTTNLFNVLCLGVLVIAGCVAVGFIVLKVMALLTASGGEYQFWADFLGKFVLPALLGIAAMLKVGSFLPEQDDRIMGYREHLKDILAAKGYPRWLAWVGQIVTLLVLGRLAIGLYLGGAWQITLIAYHGGTIWALAGWVTVGLIGLACGYVALCVGMEIVKHVKFRIFGREDDGAQCVVK